MRMSHANLHLDTNARLTDTCVWQKVQAAITARQGKTCPFKHSERSLEIFYQTNDIYYKVCTRHLVDKLLNQFLRETPFDISRGDLNDQQSCRQSPPTTCLLTSNYNVSRSAWLLTSNKKTFQVGFFFTKKGQFQVDFTKILLEIEETRHHEWLTGQDWHSFPILVHPQEMDGTFKLTSYITPGSHS